MGKRMAVASEYQGWLYVSGLSAWGVLASQQLAVDIARVCKVPRSVSVALLGIRDSWYHQSLGSRQAAQTPWALGGDPASAPLSSLILEILLLQALIQDLEPGFLIGVHF